MQDNQEGIEQIVWDLYGKVEAINRTTAAASAGKANLAFMYDALGNRTKKQVVEDPYSAGPEVHETWYVRDPQGNILANYERFVEGDSLFLYLTERPIYGSARIGVNMRRVKLSASLANQYDPPARAMQITTVMYDSPSSHKDAPEVNDGEYVVLLNTSNDTLDLGAYRLRNLLTNDDWTMTGMGSVAPGQRILLANYPSGGAASFKTLSLVTDQDLTEGDIRLTDSLGISLWDSAGAIVIEDTFGNLHDRMNYGEYFGLDARNAYVATASLGNLGDREPIQAVYRTAGLARPVGGTTPQVWVITTTGTMAGEVSLSPLPEGYTGSETGTYELERGGTAYEFTNHLGNVLAVVSDKKLGQDTDADLHAEYYHPETMMLTDYYPFGSPMVGRTWQSGGYRYGFNGMQKDNEVVGEANGYDFENRFLDSRIGRFLSMDNFANKFADQAAYLFAGNTPICGVDVNGDSLYIMNSGGQILNIESPEGKAYANQFGYNVLLMAGSGRELLNKYHYSSKHDVYITIGKTSSPNAGAETTSLPLTTNGIEKLELPQGAFQGDINKFNGISLKNPDNTFSLMVFNEDYLTSKGVFSGRDIYDFAESFFHELKSHVDLAILALADWEKQVAADPSKAKDQDLINKIEHALYGVDHKSNLGLTGHAVKSGSAAETIRRELTVLKGLQSTFEIKRDNTNLGIGGDAADGIGF